MDGDFDNVTDELVYVGPKCTKLKPRFNPMIEVEKGNMLLVRSWTEDEGEMIWIALKTTSYIFQNDESETLHVKVDWWKPSFGKYKETLNTFIGIISHINMLFIKSTFINIVFNTPPPPTRIIINYLSILIHNLFQSLLR